MDENLAVEALSRALKNQANGRASDVERGAETPRLSALLLQKYGRGLIDAVQIIFDNRRAADPLSELLDAETAKIDPDWRDHDRDRWAGSPADVVVRR